MEDYQIKKGVLGTKVLYNCPSCGVPLTSSLDKAGAQDACPDCNRPHVIPGSKDKLELEQSAAALQRKKLEAAKTKAAVQAAAKKPQTPVPNAIPPTIANQDSPPPTFVSPAKVSPPRKKFGDGILDLAFGIARGFAVIVIVVSLAVLLLVAVWFVVSYSDYRAPHTSVVNPPTDVDYKRYLSMRADAQPQSDDGSEIESGLSENAIMKILRKHKISLTESRLFIPLLSEVGKLESGEHDKFVNGLDQFLGHQQNKTVAAAWFISEYIKLCEQRESQQRSDEFHNNVITARLWMLTTLAGGIFGGLISFMVLPLLIRIEANTRNGTLAAIAAATRT